MNKRLFRLVFSKSLGFLVPVAETTRTQRKPGQTGGSSAPTSSVFSFTHLTLSLLLAGLPGWAAAQMLVDPSSHTTRVISAANGAPVIEIADPNSNGLSHNRFIEFDVDNPGVIFNNSQVNGVSQMGGMVLGNPNLTRQATAILSEVTGTRPSSIRGTLEVFGAKADILIANPNGLSVNGVSTLNSDRLTLTTGHARDLAGDLQFLVDERSGTVLVGDDGVNTDGLSYFDIVARSVALLGAVGSQAQQTDLQITAGQGTYDSASRTFTATANAQGSGVAISGEAAGAMHGRYISLISTDAGAGVRHEGVMLAAADIRIDANGDIALKDAAAGGRLDIAATGRLSNAGTLQAGGGVDIQAQDLFNSSGAHLTAGAELNIQLLNDLMNEKNGLLAADGGVRVTAGRFLNNAGGIEAGELLELSSVDQLSNSGQVLGKRMTVEAGSLINVLGGSFLAGDDLLLNLGSYSNGGLISSQNTASLTLKNQADLLINEAFKGPQAGKLLTLAARDVIVTGKLNNPGSVLIKATGDVRNQGAVIVGKNLDIQAQGRIDNEAGKLMWAAENLSLDAGTVLSNGRDGWILTQGAMSLTAGQTIQNNVGRIEAQKSLAIDTPLLENLSETSGGAVVTGEAQEDTWYSKADGPIERDYWNMKINLPVYGSNLSVKQAVIKTGGDLLVNQSGQNGQQAKVRNFGGLLAATGDVLIDGDLQNVGASSSKSLAELLDAGNAVTRWTTSSIWTTDGKPVAQTLYGLLFNMFRPDGWRSEWLDSLKLVTSPEVNQLLSATLGADWKGLDRAALSQRWAAFETGDSNKTQEYYAAQQAEISAGGRFAHTGGSFANGNGSNAGGQRHVDATIGYETLTTLDGELGADFAQPGQSAQDLLAEQLASPLFQKRQVTGDDEVFARIKPLYETRVAYLDQSQFLGSAYFMKKIGYEPERSVSVLGDAYFDHQLILQSVTQRLGNFYARQQRLSDAAVVQALLDHGAALAGQEGFTLGQPLTADQVAALQDDVVWYENRVVDGQVVLTPQVYLSAKTLAARNQDAGSAALVTANSVLIDAASVSNINGAVRGQVDTLVYSAGDLANQSKGGALAGFFAGDGRDGSAAGQLLLAAEGTVVNQGGVMQGYQQMVMGNQGIESSTTMGYNEYGYLKSFDNGLMGVKVELDEKVGNPADNGNLDKTPSYEKNQVRDVFETQLLAGPVDTSQGSSLRLESGGDINLTGTTLQSNTVVVKSIGSVNLNDLHEVASAFDHQAHAGFLWQTDIRAMVGAANFLGNTVDATNLYVLVQKDLNITGKEINAKNSDIRVGGNRTEVAGKDLMFQRTTIDDAWRPFVTVSEMNYPRADW